MPPPLPPPVKTGGYITDTPQPASRASAVDIVATRAIFFPLSAVAQQPDHPSRDSRNIGNQQHTSP